MRLIDADWAMSNRTIPVYKIVHDVDDSYCNGWFDCLKNLENEPTIDAISIIHCKDCAYFHPYPFEPEYGSCKYHLDPDLQWEEKKETDYCSDAERLKDED